MKSFDYAQDEPHKKLAKAHFIWLKRSLRIFENSVYFYKNSSVDLLMIIFKTRLLLKESSHMNQ